MNRIEQLILERCPNGVPFRTLGEICTLERGTSITKKNIAEGEVPVIAGGKTPAYYCEKSNREGETIVVAGSGAYAGFVSWWESPIFVSDAFSIKPIDTRVVLAKYCFYYLKNIQDILHSLKRGSGVPHVYAKDVRKFKIPIPPLDIQKEIVKILNKFSELQAELQARKAQYEYYRDQLLNFQTTEVAPIMDSRG